MDLNGNKALQQTAEKKPVSAKQQVRTQIEAMLPELKKALPTIGITADRMARMTLTALNNNEKLYECEIKSLLAAMVQSAQLGLEPNTPLGQAYLIPYGKTVQFIVGYKGILELAYRTNKYTSIYAKEVYKNDQFDFEYGLDPKIKHIPAKIPEGEPIYYYAIYKMQNGGFGFEVLSKEQIVKHSKKYSQAVQKGWTSPWSTDFDSMALKTVLKRVLRYAPKSTELGKAINTDETITKFTPDMTDVQNEYIEAEVISEEEKENVKELLQKANEKDF